MNSLGFFAKLVNGNVDLSLTKGTFCAQFLALICEGTPTFCTTIRKTHMLIPSRKKREKIHAWKVDSYPSVFFLKKNKKLFHNFNLYMKDLTVIVLS